MATEQVGIPVYADTAQLSMLARNLRLAAPQVWKAARVELREAGEIIASDARQRASFSTKIPGSIKVITRAGNVRVRAGGPDAPDAVALENHGKGHPRHPLFGNREHWYTNNTPAFLAPALEANAKVVAVRMGETLTRAVDRAIREHV